MILALQEAVGIGAPVEILLLSPRTAVNPAAGVVGSGHVQHGQTPARHHSLLRDLEHIGVPHADRETLGRARGASGGLPHPDGPGALRRSAELP
eukprot:12879732-Alexandrium_andersonii.AAC.1